MDTKDRRQTRLADHWFAQQGIQVGHIHAGTTELFQATKLATTTLRDYGRLLEHNQAHTLNNFLKATLKPKTRDRITPAQCFRVMNIAKQAQRKSAQFLKARP